MASLRSILIDTSVGPLAGVDGWRERTNNRHTDRGTLAVCDCVLSSSLALSNEIIRAFERALFDSRITRILRRAQPHIDVQVVMRGINSPSKWPVQLTTNPCAFFVQAADGTIFPKNIGTMPERPAEQHVKLVGRRASNTITGTPRWVVVVWWWDEEHFDLQVFPMDRELDHEERFSIQGWRLRFVGSQDHLALTLNNDAINNASKFFRGYDARNLD